MKLMKCVTMRAWTKTSTKIWRGSLIGFKEGEGAGGGRGTEDRLIFGDHPIFMMASSTFDKKSSYY